MPGLMQKLMQDNMAPGWFYLDKQKGMADKDILEKIGIELHNEAINREYDLSFWSEGFIKEISKMYFDHFNKLYHISGASQLVH